MGGVLGGEGGAGGVPRLRGRWLGVPRRVREPRKVLPSGESGAEPESLRVCAPGGVRGEGALGGRGEMEGLRRRRRRRKGTLRVSPRPPPITSGLGEAGWILFLF